MSEEKRDRGADPLPDMVNHPSHYGGADNPYEAVKVIEAWQLDFNLGNCVKYIARYKHKGRPLEDLKKRTEWAEQDARQARERADAAERSRAAYKGQLTRVKNGVCPCCRRNFSDLRRHMKTKHPGYMEEVSSGRTTRSS